MFILLSVHPLINQNYLRTWSKELSVPILSVDYSLSPEAPFPRALEECFYAYCWALKNCHLLGMCATYVLLRQTTQSYSKPIGRIHVFYFNRLICEYLGTNCIFITVGIFFCVQDFSSFICYLPFRKLLFNYYYYFLLFLKDKKPKIEKCKETQK